MANFGISSSWKPVKIVSDNVIQQSWWCFLQTLFTSWLCNFKNKNSVCNVMMHITSTAESTLDSLRWLQGQHWFTIQVKGKDLTSDKLMTITTSAPGLYFYFHTVSVWVVTWHIQVCDVLSRMLGVFWIIWSTMFKLY